MKKLILLLAIAGITTTSCLAQSPDKSQGYISYDVTVNIHASMKPDQLKFKDLVPEKVTNKETLYFNGAKAKLARKDQDETTTDEGAKIKIVTNEGQVAVYTDAATGQSWSLYEEDGKQSLAELYKEENPTTKAGGKTKQILGFSCYEVNTKSKEGDNMTLWVTDAFPINAGPLGLWPEKGVVLGVDSKKVSIQATAINYAPVSVADVSIPPGMPVKFAKK
ncbi:DUF4412 domain-containing protein [Chitinophaga sp. Hz27]|uniref:DUF4412 domain-containing protein n=1 Tax=Chitinophaga sp. Hz27 TaxID=3347169 RepID=UPI0035E02619